MGTILITLKCVRNHEYALFGPKGNQISEVFRGNSFQAKEWATKWVSSFHNWGVDSKEIDDEETSRIPEPPV